MPFTAALLDWLVWTLWTLDALRFERLAVEYPLADSTVA
jgi:hypothetical protein